MAVFVVLDRSACQLQMAYLLTTRQELGGYFSFFHVNLQICKQEGEMSVHYHYTNVSVH